jgi:glycopeptide antibiotics resistance protein
MANIVSHRHTFRKAVRAPESDKTLIMFDTERGLASPSERLDFLAGWLTLAVVFIILIGTLYPFHFSIEETASRRVGFFLFWFEPMEKNWYGWLLNLALFLPFGFAVAWWARVRQWRWLAGAVAVGAAGFALSYAVEFLQLFVVWRGSSWDDVVLNTAGALAGRWVFNCWGAGLLRWTEEAFSELIAIFER